MVSYTVNIYAISDATTNVAGIIEQYGSGDQWDWHFASNPTFELNSGATSVSTDVTDTDGSPGTLDDDSLGQTLSSDVTIGGVTYSAGSVIENEYEVVFSDGAGGTYRMVAISIDDTIIGFTFEGGIPPEGAELSYDISDNNFDEQSFVPCFTAGTWIETPKGPRAVEQLALGDQVLTVDAGAQPIVWIGLRSLSAAALRRAPHLRPISIEPGALGPHAPRRTLLVSPQHRLLIRSRIAARLSGRKEALVAAKHLCGLPGIAPHMPDAPVQYIHFALPRHHIIHANGAATETLLCGPQALRGLAPADRRELRALFPELARGSAPAAVRHVLRGTHARELARRAGKNHRDLVEPAPTDKTTRLTTLPGPN